MGFLLTIAGSVWSQTENSSQRMVIILKDPVESKTINVKVNKDLETLERTPEDKTEQPQTFVETHKVMLEKTRGNRYTLTLDLLQNGYVQLEARDFGGKKVSVLYKNYLTKGKYVIEENESWKEFRNIKKCVILVKKVS